MWDEPLGMRKPRRSGAMVVTTILRCCLKTLNTQCRLSGFNTHISPKRRSCVARCSFLDRNNITRRNGDITGCCLPSGRVCVHLMNLVTVLQNANISSCTVITVLYVVSNRPGQQDAHDHTFSYILNPPRVIPFITRVQLPIWGRQVIRKRRSRLQRPYQTIHIPLRCNVRRARRACH